MNNRHRQVVKWETYYQQQRIKKIEKSIKEVKDALHKVANAVLRFGEIMHNI